MPEPDFDRIANEIMDAVHVDGDSDLDEKILKVSQQLRQVWNARGAADIHQVNASLLTGNVPKLVDALRTLDR